MMTQTKSIALVLPGEPTDGPLPLERSTPPLGVAYLAGVLLQQGYRVDVIDACVEKLSAQEVLRRILGFGASVVGISMDLLSYAFAEILAAGCRECHLPVVVGGPEVTLNTRAVMDAVGADIAVVGEGEQTLLELLEAREAATSWDPAVLHTIKGIVFRNPDGTLTTTPGRPRLADLDQLPYVPYHILPLARYDLRYYPLLPVGPVYPVCTSRGCPFNCSFCSSREVWNRRCTFMSAPRVVDEIEHMMKTYGPAGIYFHDDNATLRKERMVGICEELLKRNLRIPWACLGRTETLDEDLLRLMKRAGCRGIWFGIESGSQRILALIRKEISLERVLEVVAAGQRVGLALGASMIVGFPTQTKDEEEETLRFLRKAKFTFVWMFPYLGYPGSDMYREFLTPGSKYIWAEKRSIILPNSEAMTWPEKVAWAQRQERRLNYTFRMARHYARSLGLVVTVKKAAAALGRNIRKKIR